MSDLRHEYEWLEPPPRAALVMVACVVGAVLALAVVGLISIVMVMF